MGERALCNVTTNGRSLMLIFAYIAKVSQKTSDDDKEQQQ
jgi:hypothetical protein